MEPLVLTEERLELFDLGMAFGNAVQYPPVFSWCGIVESKEAHTLHMARKNYLYVYHLKSLVPIILDMDCWAIQRHSILGPTNDCSAENSSA